MDTNEKDIVLSPLADPVVSAIFSDKETAGLAAASLVNAVLQEDSGALRIGEIISVTPQRYHKLPGERGCRVDIELTTANNERVIAEVQLSTNHWILHRSFFSASRIVSDTSTPGATSDEMAAAMLSASSSISWTTQSARTTRTSYSL
jgi:hypothetical protein